jgi:hypothetical protein
VRHWGQIALHTFSSSDNWKGGAADLKASTLFSKDRMHANNLACRPSTVSWPMFSHKHNRYVKEVLTNKKASTSSRCSGRSFFLNA